MRILEYTTASRNTKRNSVESTAADENPQLDGLVDIRKLADKRSSKQVTGSFRNSFKKLLSGSSKRPSTSDELDISMQHAELDLTKGRIPCFKDEKTSVTRYEYPKGLLHCKYARLVDQHHIIFSLGEGMASALLMVIDAISDMYFALQLFTSSSYDELEMSWKLTYVILVSIGVFGWLVIAACRTCISLVAAHNVLVQTKLQSTIITTYIKV